MANVKPIGIELQNVEDKLTIRQLQQQKDQKSEPFANIIDDTGGSGRESDPLLEDDGGSFSPHADGSMHDANYTLVMSSPNLTLYYPEMSCDDTIKVRMTQGIFGQISLDIKVYGYFHCCTHCNYNLNIIRKASHVFLCY